MIADPRRHLASPPFHSRDPTHLSGRMVHSERTVAFANPLEEFV